MIALSLMQMQNSLQRLSEVCMSLLKVSPYDPATMGCRGLQKYMTEVFPWGK